MDGRQNSRGGREVPSQIKDRTKIPTAAHDSNLPDSSNAKALYENTFRGRLIYVSRFGRDSLEDLQELRERRQAEFFNQSVISCIFQECVSNRPHMFPNAIFCFIHLSHNLIDLI